MQEITLSKMLHRRNLGIQDVVIIPCRVLIYAKVAWQISPAYVGSGLAE